MDDLDQQGVDATGTDAGDIDYSQFGVEQSADAGQANPQTTEQQGGDNPKWAPILEAIPQEFHGPLKNHLKDWDRGVNERFQEIHNQYAPFKRFQDQQVDPERLEQSYQVAQQLQANPVEFMKRLFTGLTSRGYSPEQIAQELGITVQQAEQVQDQIELDSEDPYARKITELERRLQERDEALAQFVQAQQQEQIQQQVYQEEMNNIEQGFAAVEQRVGKLSDPLKAEIIQRAMFMGQQSGGPVTIEEAAKATFDFLRQAQAQRKQAPRGIPGGGSIPRTIDKDPGEMSEDERLAYAKAIHDRISAGNS